MVDLVHQLETSSLVGAIIGLVTTSSRLFFRRNRFWWDDAYALLSMLSIILRVVGTFLVVHEPGKIAQSAKVAAYFLQSSTFYSAIWFARLSMLFSIIRIDPNPYQRKRLLFLAAAFFLAGLFLICQIFWVCIPNPVWKTLPITQCPLNIQVAVCQLVAAAVSDFILIAAPLKLFRDILNKGLRRRLVLIFSASIMATIVSSVHVSYILRDKKLQNLIAAHVETCVSLVVCNLPVFAVATIRLRNETKHNDTLGTSRKSIDETIISSMSE